MDSIETLMALVREYGTVREFNAFLRARDLGGGDTWEELIVVRATPALRDGRLRVADILEFLSDAEEFGTQHIFVYRYNREMNALPQPHVVEKWAKTAGYGAVFSTPSVVDKPDKPTVAAIRRERAGPRESLTIKIVEKRVYDDFVGQRELGHGRYVRMYQREEVRAVNVVRVHSDGFAEFRVYRHKNGAKVYRDDRDRLWALVADLLHPLAYNATSLVKAKNTIYQKRHQLKGVVSFTNTLVRSTAGISYTAAGKREASLFDDEATDAGFTTITANGNAYHDALNLWWRKQASGKPSQDIHVLLSGESNEFAVPQQCSRDDYEFILAEIRRYNK